MSKILKKTEEIIKNNRYLLVVDLERNCGRGIDKSKMELLEIGALVYDLEEEKITGEFESLIKPNYFLGDRIQKMTGLKNEEFELAPAFNIVHQQFEDFVLKHTNNDYVFSCWGGSDYKMYNHECYTKNIKNFLDRDSKKHILNYDLSDAFSFHQGFPRKVGTIGLNKALELIEKPREQNKTHRALYDAFSASETIPYLLRKKDNIKSINSFLKKSFEKNTLAKIQLAKELNKKKQMELKEKKRRISP